MGSKQSFDVITGLPQSGSGKSPAIDPSGRYLIGLKSDTTSGSRLPEQARALEHLNELGITGMQLYQHVGIAVARLTPQQVAALEADPAISFVEANREVTLLDTAQNAESTPTAKGGKGGREDSSGGGDTSEPNEWLDWGVRELWNGVNPPTAPGGGVAWVIDSGSSSKTGDLNISELSTGFSSSGQAGESWEDADGHGTHVAGTIAALSNGKGTVGVAPGATVAALRVFFPGEATYDDRVIAAINYVISKADPDKRNVINMSLGRSGAIATDGPYQQAIKAALGKNILFSIAAGNDNQDVDGFTPASAGDLEGVYTVSAAGRYAPHPKRPNAFVATTDTSYNLVMAHFSNYDDGSDTDDVKYAAPGLLITSLGLNGETVQMSGTSMAAPHMAGALLWREKLTPGPMVASWFTNYNGDAAPDPLVRLSA